ncbi:MAG: hypothetical protein U0892_15000 [Pirellulales bacterium]
MAFRDQLQVIKQTIVLGHTAAIVCCVLSNLLFSTSMMAQPPTVSADSADWDAAPAKLTILTWNVEWMFDHETQDNRSDLSKQQSAPSQDYWTWKVDAVAAAVANSGATIVALQEIEGDRTLADIAKVLIGKHNLSYRYAFIQGTDTFTEQDVGILQRTGLAHYSRHEQSKTMFDSGQFYNVSKHLFAEFRWRDVSSPLTLVNVHYRATSESETERTKQGKLTRHWLERTLKDGRDVVVLGDLNSEHPVGEVAGEMKELLVGTTEEGPKMVDLLQFAAVDKRRTHMILDKQFDRIVVSQSMIVDDPNGKDWVFKSLEIHPAWNIRGAGPDGQEHWDKRLTMPLTELDVSDHYPMTATFELR